MSGSTNVWAFMACLTTATIADSIFHIIEEPGAIDALAEAAPTDEYYRALREDMGIRHPRADPHLLDHLNTFEAFLDRSILAGMSFGVEKAKVAVHEGELLGHVVGRKGMRAQPEKTRAIQSFPPLKEKLHVQQFLGPHSATRGRPQP